MAHVYRVPGISDPWYRPIIVKRKIEKVMMSKCGWRVRGLEGRERGNYLETQF